MDLAQDIFQPRYVTSTDYVDVASRLDARDIVPFLVQLYREPELVLANRSTEEILGGLKAISYSGGLQWRVFTQRGSVKLPEKLFLLEDSFRFFKSYLAYRSELAPIARLWWDDLAAQNRLEDDAIVCGNSLDECVLGGKLLEVFVRALSIPSPHAQLGALAGLDALNHPKTAEVIQEFLSSGDAATDEVKVEANALM